MNSPETGTPKPLLVTAAIGAVGVAGAFFLSSPERFFMNWILWFLVILTVSLGALFMVALEHVVASVWSVPLRRVPERLASLLFLAIPMGLVALFAVPKLYPGTFPEAHSDAVLAGKAFWLSFPFFTVRVVLCFALWLLFYALLVRGSFRQDATRDAAFTVKARRLAPLFMMVFAVTLTVVSFDWISGLQPKWYSDIFGVYLFAGTFLAGVAATAVAAIYLYDRGRLEGVKGDHLYNLGGLLFAFTIFWAYIAFAQYLLMWYADMPEEVFWFKPRTHGGWLAVFIVLFLVRYAVPFFALISRTYKSNPKRLRFMAVWMLCGHVIDLYWLIFPVLGSKVTLGWQEAAFALFFASLAVIWARRAMAQGKDMPVGDPFFEAGLEFRL